MKKIYKTLLPISCLATTVTPIFALTACQQENHDDYIIPLDIYDTTSIKFPLLRSKLHNFEKNKTYYFKIDYSLWQDWDTKKPEFTYFGENEDFFSIYKLTATGVFYKGQPSDNWSTMTPETDYEINEVLGFLTLTDSGKRNLGHTSIMIIEVSFQGSGNFFFVAE